MNSMIEITCDNIKQINTIKQMIFESDLPCLWWGDKINAPCPKNEDGTAMSCKDCIEKYIKWKIKDE